MEMQRLWQVEAFIAETVRKYGVDSSFIIHTVFFLPEFAIEFILKLKNNILISVFEIKNVIDR